MAQILVRHLDERVVQTLKERARKKGLSLQAEAKSILEQSAQLNMEEALALVDRIRGSLGKRRFSDSAALIREDRER